MRGVAVCESLLDRITLPSFLRPALGGLVAAFGPRAPFWCAAGLAAANAVIMSLFLPETLAPENRRPFLR